MSLQAALPCHSNSGETQACPPAVRLVLSRSGTVQRLRKWTAAAVVVVATLAAPREGAAAVIWSSGFENNSLSDWDYELNPEGLSVVPEPVAAGQYALRAELTAQTVWSNGIFRTELQYSPNKSQVSEGDETYFGWSVYLPAALPAGDYQLGYFETRNSYNQVFSLHAEGADLSLVLNHNAATRKHPLPGLLTTGVWHRIVYHVKWSADPAIGFVSLWWDGAKVVAQANAKTFVDDDAALMQLGLLKDPPEPPQPVVLFVDEAIHGDSYADVSLGIAEIVAVAPQASAPAGTDTTGVIQTTDGASVTSGAPSTSDATSAATAVTSAAPSSGGSNSGCSFVARGGGGALAWLSVVAAWVFMTRIRGARRGN